MHYDSFDDFVDGLLAADLTASEVLDAVDARVSSAFPLPEWQSTKRGPERRSAELADRERRPQA